MADLSSFVQDSTSGLFIPPQARRNVLPWDDLQTLAQPERLSQLSPDLISALSVMVAQGPKVPILLTADEHKALRVVSETNNSSTVARPQSTGDLQLMVTDPLFATAGDVFLVIPQSGSGTHGPYQVSGKGQDSTGVISMLFPLQANTVVGDGVRRLPLVGISSAVNTVTIGNTGSLPVSITQDATPTQIVGASVATTGIFSLQGGVSGFTPHVYGCYISVEGQTAGRTVAQLQDGFGVNFLTIAVGPLQNDGVATVYHDGAALSQNQGIQLDVLQIGTGATVRCAVGFKF